MKNTLALLALCLAPSAQTLVHPSANAQTDPQLALVYDVNVNLATMHVAYLESGNLFLSTWNGPVPSNEVTHSLLAVGASSPTLAQDDGSGMTLLAWENAAGVSFEVYSPLGIPQTGGTTIVGATLPIAEGGIYNVYPFWTLCVVEGSDVKRYTVSTSTYALSSPATYTGASACDVRPIGLVATEIGSPITLAIGSDNHTQDVWTVWLTGTTLNSWRRGAGGILPVATNLTTPEPPRVDTHGLWPTDYVVTTDAGQVAFWGL